MSSLLCRRCNEPHGGDGRRRYCLACRPVVEREQMARYRKTEGNRAAQARYRRSERGRAATRRYRSSPRGKIVGGTSYLQRREKRLAQMRRYYAEVVRPRERAKYPQLRACDGVLCEATFIVGPRQHQTRFCENCIVAFYGPHRRRLRRAA